MANVFISYSRRDIEFAKRLTATLQKSEVDFWIDWEGIPPTVDWWKEIEKGIEETDVFLFLISPDSAKSKVCIQEIETAVKNGKRIVPIVVREIAWQDTPHQLGHLNYIFFSRDDDFDAAVKRLMTAIQTDYEWAAMQRRLQVKALEWERNGRERGFLLRSKDLQDAETNLARNSSKEPHPTGLQHEYVLQSRQAADKQRRLLTGVSIAGIIALATLTVFGFYQAGRATNNAATAQANLIVAQTAQVDAQNKQVLADNNAATAVANEQIAKEQAQIALARQLAAQAKAMSTTRNALGDVEILLAIQSMRMFPTSEAAEILSKDILLHGPVFISHDYRVYSVAFSPDGKYVVSGGDSTALVWEVATGKEVAQMDHNTGVYSVAISPDDKYVVSGDGPPSIATTYDSTVRVWEVATGKEVVSKAHEGVVSSIAFSPDGKYVVSGDGKQLSSENDTGTAYVWEVATGKEIVRMDHHGAVTCVAFSPDGKYIVSGSYDRTIRVWNAATGKEVTRIMVAYPVYSVAFGPDGQYIVSGGQYFDAHVWEVATGKEVAIMAHDEFVSSVVFSPDGKYVASGSWDATARVWDIATGKEVARMTHDDIVSSVAFSPDGKYVVSGSYDSTARMWKWQTQDLIVSACARVHYNMTPLQWDQYVGDALPYQTVCDNLPIEPEATSTP